MIEAKSGRTLVLFVLFSTILSIMMVGVSGDHSDSIKDISVDSNAYKPILLKGLDRDGDVLEMTLRPKAIEGKQTRRLNFYLTDENTVNRFGMFEEDSLKTYSMYHQTNLTTLFEKRYECTWDKQVYLVLDNPYIDGDEADTFNSTAWVRLDYTVTDSETSSGNLIVTIVIVVFAVLIIAGLAFLAVLFFKRKVSDRRSFFVRGDFMYYALQGPDGRIYYYGPDQYARMYSSGSLAGFQFLGYTREIGGQIYNETGAVPGEIAPVGAEGMDMSYLSTPMPSPEPIVGPAAYPEAQPVAAAMEGPIVNGTPIVQPQTDEAAPGPSADIQGPGPSPAADEEGRDIAPAGSDQAGT